MTIVAAPGGRVRRGRGRTRDDRQSQTPKRVRMLTSKIIRRFLATSGGAVRATKEWPPVNEENDGPQRATKAQTALDFFAAAEFSRIGRSPQAGRTSRPFKIFFPQHVRSWTLERSGRHNSFFYSESENGMVSPVFSSYGYSVTTGLNSPSGQWYGTHPQSRTG